MSDVTSDSHLPHVLSCPVVSVPCLLSFCPHPPSPKRKGLGEFENGLCSSGAQRAGAQRALARSALALSAPQVHCWIRGSDLRIAHPQDPRPYSMSLTQTLTRANHYELQSKEATVNHSIT